MTIEVGDFAVVQNDNLKEYNVCKEDIVYVAGDALAQVSEEDPYLMRRIMIVARMKEDHIDVTAGAFTMEGPWLVKVDDFTQARLDKQRKADFADEATH